MYSAGTFLAFNWSKTACSLASIVPAANALTDMASSITDETPTAMIFLTVFFISHYPPFIYLC